MKKLLCALLCVLMLLSLAACSGSKTDDSGKDVKTEDTTTDNSSADNKDASSGDADPADYKIGICVKHPDEYQTAMQNGAVAACEDIGLKYEALSPTSTTDVQEQVEIVETFISQKCNAIIIDVMDPASLVPSLNNAYDQGILIFTFDANPQYEHQVAFVGLEEETAAHGGAVAFAEFLPENANVIVLGGIAGDANGEFRDAGFRSGCEEAGINILEECDTDWTAEGGASYMEDMITKYGDKIDGILTSADDIALGAYNVIVQAGLQDQIKICGYGGSTEAMNYINDGKFSMTIKMKFYETGYIAVESAWTVLQGGTVDEFVNVGCEYVNKDNVANFING